MQLGATAWISNSTLPRTRIRYQRLQEDGLAEYRDGVVRSANRATAAAVAGDVLRSVPACHHEQPRYSRAI